MANTVIRANIIDILARTIREGIINFHASRIDSIEYVSESENPALPYACPGFIDSHVHIESSMLVPSEFAKLAVVHGTVATVSDPHEIANVCGMEGVEFMIENGKTVPFKFNFGAPSCVPATVFETAGAAINADEVGALLQKPEIKYLSEMMNFPGVLFGDPEVMKKIEYARAAGKPIDGHAPGLRGEQAKQYIRAGGNDENVIISTDHECFTAEEALDKLKWGMKIIIREGSAAKNFEALIPLIEAYENMILFCSDDKHPDSLLTGHINQLCARAVAKGYDLFKVLKAACMNPVLHYSLEVGLLRKGDWADCVILKDLSQFEVLETYINGKLVAKNGTSLIEAPASGIINLFSCEPKKPDDFICHYHGPASSLTVPVMEALDGQLITLKTEAALKVSNHAICSDSENDILKIAVVNRYQNVPVALAFIKNFGIKNGAIASSVAHDSHNIVAVGTSDELICRAVNLVIAEQGGVSAVSSLKEKVLGLPVAGLMSDRNGYVVAKEYTAIDKMVKEELNSTLAAPFMTLSFMALLVIPHLKLSDKGLFDGDQFAFMALPS